MTLFLGRIKLRLKRFNQSSKTLRKEICNISLRVQNVNVRGHFCPSLLNICLVCQSKHQTVGMYPQEHANGSSPATAKPAVNACKTVGPLNDVEQRRPQQPAAAVSRAPCQEASGQLLTFMGTCDVFFDVLHDQRGQSVVSPVRCRLCCLPPRSLTLLLKAARWPTLLSSNGGHVDSVQLRVFSP